MNAKKIKGGYPTQNRDVTMLPEDIEHARARDQFGCAVVRAIQRKYPEAVRVRVNKNLVGFTIGEDRYTYPTPEAVVEAIIKPLDTGQGIPEPIVIQLRGGRVADVQHWDERTKMAARVKDRNRRANSDISERRDQMSPMYREYDRFAEDN